MDKINALGNNHGRVNILYINNLIITYTAIIPVGYLRNR